MRCTCGRKVAVVCEKSAKMFGGFGNNAYLCAMMDKKEHIDYWTVTGVSRLTGEREELTGGIPSREMAVERMRRYQENTRRQRYPTYMRLRVEKRLPIQLTIPFND